MALLIYLLTTPPRWDSGAPLQWDFSGHLLRAKLILQASSALDFPGLSAQIFRWDVYPPFYHLLLGLGLGLGLTGLQASIFIGAIFLTSGTVGAGLLFGAVGLRKSLAASLLIGLAVTLSAFNLSLLHLPMLGVPASMLALLALGLMSHALARNSWKNLAWAAGVATLASLTKYNIGLPLCASLFLTGLWIESPESARSRGFRSVLLAFLPILLTAGFLTLQDHGWLSFLSFATNRENSSDMGMGERLGWYANFFTQYLPGSPRIILGAALLALVGLIKDARKLAPSFAYLILIAASIASHPYLLSRNGVSLYLVGGVLGVLGLTSLLQRLPWDKRIAPTLLLLILGFQILNTGVPNARDLYSKWLTPQSLAIQPVAASIRERMREVESLRVVGSFQELSRPALNLMWLESGHASLQGFKQELPLVGVRTRGGVEYQKNGREAEPHLQSWLNRSPERYLLTIGVAEDGPYWGGDHLLWNSWKQEYVRAAAVSSGLEFISTEEFADLGIRLDLYQTKLVAPAVRQGWSDWEPWGIWMIAQDASVELPAGSTFLEIEWAPPSDTHGEHQGVAIYWGEERLAHQKLPGKAWEWSTFRLKLPESMAEERNEIRLVADYLFAPLRGDRQSRALPVRSLRTEP